MFSSDFKQLHMKHYAFLLLTLLAIWGCTFETQTKEELPATDKHVVASKLPVVQEEDSMIYAVKDIDPVWLQADFDSADAVILDGSHELMYDVSKMDTKYTRSGKRKVTDAQLTTISENLSGKNQRNYLPADCFQPYHGFLFYKKGKIAGRLAICFSCRTYFSQPRNCGRINYEATKQIFHELGLPTYDWNDSSEAQNSAHKYSDYF
jgi:hypothetical protein